MPKRKPPSAIFLEWERIVFHSQREDGTYPPEEERAWRKLWDKHIEGDNLKSTAIDDATLVCRLGWSIAMSHGEFVEAVSRIDRLFEHPEIDKLPAWECADHRCLTALAWLMNGETDPAVGLYLSILGELSDRDLRNTTNVVRNQLYGYCGEQDAAATAPDSLVRLVEQIIELKAPRRGLLKQITASDISYGALAYVLRKTYPHNGPAWECTTVT